MNNKLVLAKEHYYSFNFLRAVAMLGVILYHTAGAYSFLAPYWPVQDKQSFIGDGLRELLVVFIMPFFFFIAGFFTLPSLRNNTIMNFIWNKFKRLGSYWIFIILIVIPFFIWKQLQLSGNYFDYWLSSLLSFKDIRVGPLTPSKYNHMHFWFISLLFYIFILFGLFNKIASVYHGKKVIDKNKIYKNMTIFVLLTFGLLTAAADYIFIIFFPDSSWIVIPKVLQFNVNQLLILVLYFGFGVYSKYKEWFIKNDLPFKLNQWISIALLLTILYFIIGHDVFKNIDISNTLSPIYLLFFSLVRSFLLLSYLIMFLSLAMKYFIRKNTILTKIADVSYEIYLVHIFIVGGFQVMFKRYASIPVVVKICTIFIIATFISYFFGKYTLKKYPKISTVVMFILFFVLMVIFNR